MAESRVGDRGRRLTWAQGASLVVRRLGDGPRARSQFPSARIRHLVMGIDVWCALAGGLGHMIEDGSAVVCLRPPHYRQMLRYLVVVGNLFVAVAAAMITPSVILGSDSLLWWVWAVVVGSAFAVMAGGWSLVAVRQARIKWAVRSRRSELRGARPRDGWYVYDFAGDPERQGQGRLLLERVCREADRHERVLYLDTLGHRPPGRSLVGYYAEHGFVVVGDVDVQLAGEQLVQFLMVREPQGVAVS